MLGTLYLLVGCSLAFVTYLAPRIQSSRVRDSCSLVGALIAASSMYQT
jgi:oligosaccharyltransferase complex subunit gamma